MISWLLTQLFNPGPDDNREAYVRDEHGQALSLRVSGPEITYLDIYDLFDTPPHERYLHDGTPHQNPAVVERWEWRWFLFFPYRVRVQDRYYPLTLGDEVALPDDPLQFADRLNAIERKIRVRRVRRGQRVEIAPMPKRIERQAWRREDLTQRGRGVPPSRLKRWRNKR